MLFIVNTVTEKPRGSTSRKCALKKAKFFEGIGWGILGLLVLLASMFISSKVAAENDELGAGKLKLLSNANAVHLSTEVKARINGLVARVDYRQRFKNDTPHWQEAVYVFPLPENAAVNHLQLKVGERIIVGEIQEKKQAKKTYEKAKREGKKAALLEQQRSNIFTQNVANIAPGEEVQIEITYQQMLRYESGRFEWRLPATLTPRYIPGIPLVDDAQIVEEKPALELNPFGWALPTNLVPDADSITPFMVSSGTVKNPITLELELDAGLPLAEINALYHDIDVEKIANIHRVSFLRDEESMDRDLVIHWRPIASAEPTAALFRETLSDPDNTDIDGDYLLLMMLPPSVSTNENSLPRDMVFVIDTSGSMQGASMIQAKKSLMLALERLQPSDRFNIVEFDSGYSQLFSDLAFVDSANIEHAKHWVQSLTADGGTEMLPALKSALLQTSGDEQRVQQVVFITDGAVGNENALFKLIHERLNNTRLFTVGIGSAPNSYFMKKSAQIGRGTFTFIGDLNDVEIRMDELFRKLESVLAKDIVIAWPQPVEVFPGKIPDLYAGEPLMLAVKAGAAHGELFVEGLTANKTWTKSLSLNVPNSRDSGIAAVWARAKVDALEDTRLEGRSEEEVKNDIVPLAIAHKLVTRYTSFVAVDKTPARPTDELLKSSPIPNLVPKGQTVSAVKYPKTATNMGLHFYIGALCSMCFVFVRVWRRK